MSKIIVDFKLNNNDRESGYKHMPLKAPAKVHTKYDVGNDIIYITIEHYSNIDIEIKK